MNKVEPDQTLDQIKPEETSGKKEDAVVQEQPQGNMTALVIYTLLIGLGNIQAGFAIAGNN